MVWATSDGAEESVGVHAGWPYDLTIVTSVHSPEDAAELLPALLDEFPRLAR